MMTRCLILLRILEAWPLWERSGVNAYGKNPASGSAPGRPRNRRCIGTQVRELA
jgi:hypothetical protein